MTIWSVCLSCFVLHNSQFRAVRCSECRKKVILSTYMFSHQPLIDVHPWKIQVAYEELNFRFALYHFHNIVNILNKVISICRGYTAVIVGTWILDTFFKVSLVTKRNLELLPRCSSVQVSTFILARGLCCWMCMWKLLLMCLKSIKVLKRL